MIGAINPIAFSFLNINVHWYGIIIASAMVLATILSVQEAKKRRIEPDSLYDIILWGLPIALICARMYYVVFQWGYYQYHLNEIIQIWNGGIAIYGGLIGALLVVIIYCRIQWVPIWLTLDIIAPTVILAQGIGRWGNFINQEAYGKITSLTFLHSLHLPSFIINQMYVNGFYRQPTFLYESIWDILGFVLLISLRHRPHLFKQGEVFLTYVAWYAFGRFFVEGMRTDSLMFMNIRVSQWLSIILFIGSISLMVYRRYSKRINSMDYLAGNEFIRK